MLGTTRSSCLRSVLFWTGCFLAPIAILCLVAALRGVYPFGGQSFLVEDLTFQYVDFFAWFRRVLAGEESVFYSTACGLGANTWGLYSYYLASPFNLIILFFDEDHLTLFAFVLVALKLGCMQLSATYYLRRRFGLSRVLCAALALGYTWSLWATTDLRNPMWLDALILLPLCMLAVWHLVREGRWVGLCVLTAVDVICCWYTAYMTVLFLILWTILEWWCAGREDASGARVLLWRLAVRFARPMLVALLLCAWTFVPTVLAMLESGGVEETSLLGIVQGILGAGSLGEAARRLFTTTPAYLLRGLVPALYDKAHAIPQLYCGVLAMAGYVGFFACKAVPARAKRGLGAVSLVILASIVLSPLQAVWCGFRAPTGFYSRVSVFVAPTMVWAAGWLAGTSGLPTSPRLVSQVCGSARVRGVLAVLAFAEVALGAYLAWGTVYVNYSQSYHDAYVSDSREQLAGLETLDANPWRADRTYTRAGYAALNDAIARGYVSLSSYSSAHNQEALDFLSALGYSREGQISVRYAHPILLSDALLGVRYVSSMEPVAGESLVTGLSAPNGGATYENSLSLSLGYVVSDDAVGASLTGQNPFERQNEFASALLGRKVEVFRPCDASEVASEDGSRTWEVTVPSGCLGYAYAETDDAYADGVDLEVDGTTEQEHWRFQHAARPFSEVEAAVDGVHRVITRERSGAAKAAPLSEVMCDFYCLDLDALAEVTDELAAHQVSFESFSGKGISGTVAADADGWCMVSVPHESGWTVTVNGKAVQTEGAYGDALTLVPVTQGKNRIEMTFVSPGFVPGCAVSLASVLGLAGWAALKRRRARHS